MAKIKCNAETCGYNMGSTCNKKHISVEGLFSKSKIGTFCCSFSNPHHSDELKNEMAKEMNLDEINPSVSIACSANYCAYNDKNYCKATEIKVGNSNAKYRSETQCDSFKLK